MLLTETIGLIRACGWLSNIAPCDLDNHKEMANKDFCRFGKFSVGNGTTWHCKGDLCNSNSWDAILIHVPHHASTSNMNIVSTGTKDVTDDTSTKSNNGTRFYVDCRLVVILTTCIILLNYIKQLHS